MFSKKLSLCCIRAILKKKKNKAGIILQYVIGYIWFAPTCAQNKAKRGQKKRTSSFV